MKFTKDMRNQLINTIVQTVITILTIIGVSSCIMK
jgi:hypothetical protein